MTTCFLNYKEPQATSPDDPIQPPKVQRYREEKSRAHSSHHVSSTLLRCRNGKSRSFQWRNVRLLPFRVVVGYCCNATPPIHRVNLTLRNDSPMAKQCSHGTLRRFSLDNSHINHCYLHQDLHLIAVLSPSREKMLPCNQRLLTWVVVFNPAL